MRENREKEHELKRKKRWSKTETPRQVHLACVKLSEGAYSCTKRTVGPNLGKDLTTLNCICTGSRTINDSKRAGALWCSTSIFIRSSSFQLLYKALDVLFGTQFKRV